MLHVSGTKEEFVLGADEKLKEEAARTLVDLREAINRGKTISGVTGRVQGWSGPYPKVLASYPPGEMPPPRPVLIVMDFRDAK